MSESKFFCPTHKCTLTYADCAARREKAKDEKNWMQTPTLEDCAECPGPPAKKKTPEGKGKIVCIKCGKIRKHRAKGMCTACYMVWYRNSCRNGKGQTHPSQHTKVPSILVAFGGREDIYKALIEKSKSEYRTPEEQILFFIAKGMEE